MHHSFTTFRQADRTWRGIRDAARALQHRAFPGVLAVLVVYKILTNQVFVPALQGLWALTLRAAPVNYLTNSNANQIFTSPPILGGIVLIALLAAFWNLYQFSLLFHGFELARRGEALRPGYLFSQSLWDLRHALRPRNWGILLYSALLIPCMDLFLTSSWITQLAVPEYFLGLIRAQPAWLALYGAVLTAVFLLSLFWVLVLPLFTLERMDLPDAVRRSVAYAKPRFFRLTAVLLRWGIGVLVQALLICFGPAALLYGIASLIGLRSHRVMLLFARVLFAVVFPFLGFLMDCRITAGQGTILQLLYDRHSDLPLEALPEPSPGRSGKKMLTATVSAGVLLVFCGAAAALYALPQDSALLTAVGGVRPLVTFHRGDCSVAPENTLPAFRSAILKGGDRVELDVQMTRDGVAMVTHDTSLKRCTGRNARIYDLTCAQVQQLDAGRWFSRRFAGTAVPTLEEVLRLCQGRIGLNVEIKPSASTPTLEAETIRLLRKYGFDGTNCVITSQSYETLHKVKELAPEYPTGYILALGVGNYYDLPDADFFSVEASFITSGMVNQIHRRGKTISAWTIVRESDASRMLELGVDDLITDKPDMVQDLLAKNQKAEDPLADLRDLLNALLHPEQPADPDTLPEENMEDAVEDPAEFVDAA